MTWFSYTISLVLLLSIILEYRLKHVNKDGRTAAHKRARRVVLGVAILSIALQQIVAVIKDSKTSRAEAALRSKVDIANKNIGELLAHQSELLAALGTNASIDPKLRVEILEHSRAVELVNSDVSELEQWKTDFKNEQVATKLQENAAKLRSQIADAEQKADLQARVDRTWKRATPLYDLIIRTLQETIMNTTKDRGEKVFSDYAGLPALPTGQIVHVANITTGTNLGWRFEISAEGMQNPMGAEVWLNVNGSCTNHDDNISYRTMFRSVETSGRFGITNSSAESYLFIDPHHSDFDQKINLEEYQTNVVTWIHRFIAAYSIRYDSR